MKVAFITGGSSGIGFETAKALKNHGVIVYEMSRHENPQEGVIHICGDVTDSNDVKAAVETVISNVY